MKKKIVWVTGDYFIDVDLPIIPILSHYYNIDWYILIGKNVKINHEHFVRKSMDNSLVNIHFHYLKHRSRSVNLFIDYYKIINEISHMKVDCYYFNYSGLPCFFPLVKLLLPVKKCIIATHNVSTPKGAVNSTLAAKYMSFILNAFDNFHVFSNQQKEILLSRIKRKNVFLAPLALKDYGSSGLLKRKDKIVFLNFGNIVEYKRLDILIEAAQILHNKGYNNFVIKIAGSCSNWTKYQRLVKDKDFFELEIRKIPNEEVAALFEQSHYFVLPYQDIAQSGAMTVALNYNLPILASDLDAFKEFVIDKETGYSFHVNDVHDLASKMELILNSHDRLYDTICNNLQLKVKKELDNEVIADQYVDFFNSLSS